MPPGDQVLAIAVVLVVEVVQEIAHLVMARAVELAMELQRPLLARADTPSPLTETASTSALQLTANVVALAAARRPKRKKVTPPFGGVFFLPLPAVSPATEG
jgi:hypothetical protein